MAVRKGWGNRYHTVVFRRLPMGSVGILWKYKSGYEPELMNGPDSGFLSLPLLLPLSSSPNLFT